MNIIAKEIPPDAVVLYPAATAQVPTPLLDEKAKFESENLLPRIQYIVVVGRVASQKSSTVLEFSVILSSCPFKLGLPK